MSKQTEALKLALEGAANYIDALGGDSRKYWQALAEQETVLPGGGHIPAVPVAVYGYCPECGGAGVMRERRPNGDDKCTNGHKYPSSKALAEQPAKEKAPQSANCEAPGWISSDHARGNDCTTEQPYPVNFIDALKYDVAKRDSEAQQAYKDAFVNGTGVMLGDKRIDPASIYKQPEQEPVAMYEDWYNPKSCGHCGMVGGHTKICRHYTTPPQRKPLTDEEIYKLCRNEGDEHSTCFIFNKDGTWSVLTLARAIEAAHGIKGDA